MKGAKIMRLPVLLCAAGVFLSGCATMEWVNPDKPRGALFGDRLACQDVANRMAWERYPKLDSVTIQNTNIATSVKVGDGDDGSKEGKIHPAVNALPVDPYAGARDQYWNACVSDCLYSKGWVYQEIPKEK